MGLPETDLARIRRFCRTVTFVELRPPWETSLGGEWTEIPQARMKYDDQTCIFNG